MVIIEGYKILKNTRTIAKVISPKGKKYKIDIDYYNSLVKGDFNKRIDYENTVVGKLPKELPLNVKKYLVFSYISDF